MWTYSGDPNNNAKDEVRFLIGDTDEDHQLVSDEEINYALLTQANHWIAAADVLETQATKYAGAASSRIIGGMSITYGSRTESFRARAASLRTRGRIAAGKPYAGGISQADKEAKGTDSDRISTAVTMGMHDNWGNPNWYKVPWYEVLS